MASGRCDQCGVEEYMPYVCKFCKGRYCAAHRLPENHGCAGLGAHRERVRADGRIMRPEPTVVSPRVSTTARAGMSMDAFWARVDGKMTWVILGLTVAVFVLQFIVLGSAGNAAHDRLFVIDGEFYLKPWVLLTNIFSHGSINHILFNMLFLVFFGSSLERLLGSRRFTNLYLVGGVVAGLAQVFVFDYLFGFSRGALGASGALQALMGTMVLLAPRLTVLVFGIVPAPLWAFAGFFVLMDVMGAFNPNSGTGHFAHLAGLAVGLAYGQHLKNKGVRVQTGPPREPATPWR